MTKEDHVFIVLDAINLSCFNRTDFEYLPSEEYTLKAGAPAVWTIPSFMSYFLGFSPADAEEFVFDTGQKGQWIPEKLQDQGYNVNFHTGSAWMSLHQDMFDKGWDNYDAELDKDRMDAYSEYTSYESPFVEVFHVLEPHHPSFSGEEQIDFQKDAFHNFDAQQQGLRYVDEKFGEMLENIPEGTVVTLTADHGEAMGEEESWGHNPNSANVEEGYRLKSVPKSVSEIPYARGTVETDIEGNKFVNWTGAERLKYDWGEGVKQR